MRPLRPLLSLLSVSLLLTFSAAAQDKPAPDGVVILKEPSWQAVLDKLFGTPEKGLLDGRKAFEFRAEDVTLTADQSGAFFNSSLSSSRDLAALIDAAIALHGQVRIDGRIDGKPFELKLAGRELKVEGITLTRAQREALTAELLGISGLRQVKIDALVDGKEAMIVVAGGKERISLVRGERPEDGRGDDQQKLDGPQKLDRPQKLDIERKADGQHKVEIERGVRADTRVERDGRVDGKIERIDVPRAGK